MRGWRGAGHAPRGLDPARLPQRPVHGLTLVSLEDFRRADVVSLHPGHTPESQGIVTRALLTRMKAREAWFVNTARARLVDNEALVELLRAGRIRGAALDVHETEPIPPGDYFFRHAAQRADHAAHRLQHARGVGEHAAIAIETVQAFARASACTFVNGV